MTTILFLLLGIVLIEGKLKFLMTLHRHGARTPNKFYKEGYWPEKKCQLTELGRQQLHALGRKYRERYILNESAEIEGFFPQQLMKGNSKDFLVISSPKGRALDSFFEFYKGLFNDSNNVELRTMNITNDLSFLQELTVNDSEVRIHLPSLKKDFFLHAHDEKVCKNSGRAKQNIKASKSYLMKLEEYRKNLFPTLAEETNKKWNFSLNPKTMTFKEMSSVLDLVTSASAHNLSRTHPNAFPAFSQEVLKLLRKAKRYFIYEVKFGDDFLPKITVTMILRLLNKILGSVFQGNSQGPKWLEVSAHDTDVAAFLKSLLTKVELWSLPEEILNIPYASHIEFEVHQKGEEEPIVKFIYNDLEISLRKCGNPCSLNKFMVMVGKMSFPGDLEKVCTESNIYSSSKCKCESTFENHVIRKDSLCNPSHL